MSDHITSTASSTDPIARAPAEATKVAHRIRSLMVSTSFPADLDDWRGLFMRHLADALGRHPSVSLQLWSPPGEVHVDVAFDLRGQEREWLKQLMADGGIAHLVRRHRVRGLVAVARLMLFLRRV